MEKFLLLPISSKLRSVISDVQWKQLVSISDTYTLLNLDLFLDLQPRLELAVNKDKDFYSQLKIDTDVYSIMQYEYIIMHIHTMCLIVLSPSELEAIIVSREPPQYQPVVKEVLDGTSDDDLGWLWMSLPYVLNGLPTIFSMIAIYKWVGREGILRVINFARNVPGRVIAVGNEFNAAVVERDIPAAVNAVGEGIAIGLEGIDIAQSAAGIVLSNLRLFRDVFWLTGDLPASLLAVGTNMAVVRAGGYENIGRIVGRGMQSIGNGAVYTGGQIIDGAQGLGEGMGMAAQTMRDNAVADITSIANGLTYVARSTISGATSCSCGCNRRLYEDRSVYHDRKGQSVCINTEGRSIHHVWRYGNDEEHQIRKRYYFQRYSGGNGNRNHPWSKVTWSISVPNKTS